MEREEYIYSLTCATSGGALHVLCGIGALLKIIKNQYLNYATKTGLSCLSANAKNERYYRISEEDDGIKAVGNIEI